MSAGTPGLPRRLASMVYEAVLLFAVGFFGAWVFFFASCGVDATAGAEAALGSYKLVVCLPPDDVPPGTPGRATNGARLLDATFTTNNVFTVPAGAAVWKTITTPYAPAIGRPNPAATVETRAYVAPGAATITSRVTNRARRTVRF